MKHIRNNEKRRFAWVLPDYRLVRLNKRVKKQLNRIESLRFYGRILTNKNPRLLSKSMKKNIRKAMERIASHPQRIVYVDAKEMKNLNREK